MDNQSNGLHLFENVEKDLSNDFGNWEVKDDGGMTYHGNSLHNFTEVNASQLKSIDLAHMMSRSLDNLKDSKDFFFAYLTALRNAGFKTLTIDLNNHYSSQVE